MTRLREQPYEDMPTHNVLTGVWHAARARVGARRVGWSITQHMDADRRGEGTDDIIEDIEIVGDVVLTLSALGQDFCILRQGPKGVIWSADCKRVYGSDFPIWRTHIVKISGDQQTFERDCMMIKVVGADQPDYSHVPPVRDFNLDPETTTIP